MAKKINRKDSKNRVLRQGEYARADGGYEYRWTDKNGQRHSRYRKNLADLRELEDQIYLDILEGISTEGYKLTLDDIFTKWIQVKRGLKEVTKNKYIHDYHKYIQPTLGSRSVDSVKISDIRAFYNDLYEVRKFTVGTIGTIHRVLHQVLEFAVDDDLIRKNPAKKALKEFTSATKDEPVTRKAMTIEEQDLFEDFIENSQRYNRWQPLFTVMLWTGLRAGEVSALRWDDVDFEKNMITVTLNLIYVGDEQLKNNRSVITTPKSAASVRTIPMLPNVRAALLREQKIQKLMGEKCTETIDGYTNFIFLTRNGGPKHVWGINDALSNIVKACNTEVMAKWDEESNGNGDPPVTLPDLTCHWLRHTFATRCCESRMDPKAIQGILGHADYETTMDVYVESTEQMKKAEVIYLEQYFSKRRDGKKAKSSDEKTQDDTNEMEAQKA